MPKELQSRQEMLVNAAAESNAATAIQKMEQIITSYENRVKNNNYDHESLTLDFIAGASNKKGESILHIAQSPEVIKYAVNKCPDLLYRVDNSGHTPLMAAALQGKESVFKALLEADKQQGGGMLNTTCYPGNKTALHLVLENNRLSESVKERMVKTLLEYGADATVLDATNKQPSDYTKNPKIKNMLSAAAANQKSTEGQSLAQQSEQPTTLQTLRQFPSAITNNTNEDIVNNMRQGRV